MPHAKTFALGAVVWGDTGLQAGAFADEANPHRNPLASSDPDWNTLVNDYISKTPDSVNFPNTIAPVSDAVPLTLQGFPTGLSDLLDVVDSDQGAIVHSITRLGRAVFGVPPLGTGIMMNVSPFNVSPLAAYQDTTSLLALDPNTYQQRVTQTFNFLKATGQINTLLSSNVIGLNFAPLVAMGANMSTLTAIQAAPLIAGTASLTNYTGVNVAPGQGGLSPGVTNFKMVNVAPGGGFGTIATSIGFDLGAMPASTLARGFRQTGTDPNVFAGKMRVGDTTAPNIGLEARLGFGVVVVSKSANYTMLPTDAGVLATGGTGGITITLPAANAGGASIGQKVFIIKIDSGAGAVTVAAAGTDTIEGAASLSLPTQYKKAILVSDNISKWLDLGGGLV